MYIRPLPPIQPIAFQPLGDCEKSYYYAIAKKGYSQNELLFNISHLISIPTKGNTKEHKKINQELPNKSTIDTPKTESFPLTKGNTKEHKKINQECVAYAKKERKICFQGSVGNCRVDRTVWNHNTLPLPVTLDPLEYKNIIRHLNGTNNKILNNLHYNKTSTLLEDHYFQERLEQYRTPFTVYQLNKMYTGTFKFLPADKNLMYDPTRNPALNVSKNFATTDYDAHINTKIDYTISHVSRSMTVQGINTLHTKCELERNQLLTKIAMSVQNPQLAGFF